MAFDIGALTGGFGGTVVSWMSTMIFWVIVIALLAIAGVTWVWWRKKRRFDKPVLELYDLSNVVYDNDGKIDLDRSTGVFDFKITKGGWFKNKFSFGGLWDYGSEWLFRLQDMTPVYDVSHNDYRKINGVNGLVVIRNPNDSKFAIPISKFFISRDSRVALTTIASVDLRNAAANAIEQVDTEMQTKWQQWAPIITAAFIGLVLIFSILLITQYGKHMVDQAATILKNAGEVMGRNAANVVSSSAP
jgi:hypothetical protein